MIAVFVETHDPTTMKRYHAFAGTFENIGESVGYLKFLEERHEREEKKKEVYIQIGFEGWEK